MRKCWRESFGSQRVAATILRQGGYTSIETALITYMHSTMANPS
jgi:hypothetical protein